MADGVLTPAVSVTSAAAGIAVAKPFVANDITGISLVGVFRSLLPLRFAEDRNRLSSSFSSPNHSVPEDWVSRSLPVSIFNPHPRCVPYLGIQSRLSG